MELLKVILALLFVLKLVSTSIAVRHRNRIAPDEIIRILSGQTHRGRFEEVEIGTREANDCMIFLEIVEIPPPRFGGTIQEERTFHTRNDAIITQVIVTDPVALPYTGGFVQKVNYGPGFKNVTLKFYSRQNSGITKVVELLGHP